MLEVLVALTVLAIAMVGLIHTASVSTSAGARSKDQSAALAIATEKVEELRGTRFEDVAAGSASDDRSMTGEPGSAFRRSWTITDTTLEGISIKEIVVTVSSPAGGPLTLRARLSRIPRTALGLPAAYLRNWNQG